MRMRHLSNLAALLSSIAVLFGCAAAMVPETSDPARKLGWATVLLEQQDRPLPAERLIREAIEIYQSQNDDLGLAEGYRKYGIFFRSPSVKKWGVHFREKGFLDKSATFDLRLDKAIEYFAKSRDIYAKAQSYDKVSNVELNLAWVYEDKGERDLACKSLDNSLASNIQFVKLNPNTKIVVADNYKSFEEAIEDQRRRAKCP
jgi:tetratricopeptide (TPR) repeat protein